MSCRARFIAYVAALLATVVSARAQDVRVRIFDLASPQKIEIGGVGGAARLYAADYTNAITELGSGEQTVITQAPNQFHVTAGDLSLYASSLRIEPEDGAELAIAVLEGASTSEPRTYAGRLIVSQNAGGMTLVNEVDLEDYVASVVASEYGFDDLEGSKAMAVVVRTYTIGVLGKYGSDYHHVDHTRSQVYRGSVAVTPVARRASMETSGEILTHDGDPIRAVYFAQSGGHTADNEDVWEGGPLPYLRGKEDPYGAASPHAAWSARIPRSRLLGALRSAYHADVRGFVIDERSDDGRVESVRLLVGNGRHRTISGNAFRLLVMEHFGMRSVRSTLFDARKDGDEYVFEGRGFGHGVGLSQWGARDMALRGMSYREILDFYYTDVGLATVDGVDLPLDDEIRVADLGNGPAGDGWPANDPRGGARELDDDEMHHPEGVDDQEGNEMLRPESLDDQSGGELLPDETITDKEAVRGQSPFGERPEPKKRRKRIGW